MRIWVCKLYPLTCNGAESLPHSVSQILKVPVLYRNFAVPTWNIENELRKADARKISSEARIKIERIGKFDPKVIGALREVEVMQIIGLDSNFD